MTELYREEETYWIYMNGKPYKRASKAPDTADIYELQTKFPTANFTLKREERRVTELRSFQPLQRQDVYTKN